MVLCLCSKSHGGPGRNKVPYLQHLYYCEFYYDDIYGLSYHDFTYYLIKIQRIYKLYKHKKLMKKVQNIIFLKKNKYIDFNL